MNEKKFISNSPLYIFMHVDQTIHRVNDAPYTVYIAQGSPSHIYIALDPRAAGNVKFCYFPELCYCPVIIKP